jgi:hypothetical protein
MRWRAYQKYISLRNESRHVHNVAKQAAEAGKGEVGTSVAANQRPETKTLIGMQKQQVIKDRE